MNTLDRITGHSTMESGAAFIIDDHWRATVQIADGHLARVRIVALSGADLDRTWTLTPGPDLTSESGLHPGTLINHAEPTPWEGASRSSPW